MSDEPRRRLRAPAWVLSMLRGAKNAASRRRFQQAVLAASVTAAAAGVGAVIAANAPVTEHVHDTAAEVAALRGDLVRLSGQVEADARQLDSTAEAFNSRLEDLNDEVTDLAVLTADERDAAAARIESTRDDVDRLAGALGRNALDLRDTIGRLDDAATDIAELAVRADVAAGERDAIAGTLADVQVTLDAAQVAIDAAASAASSARGAAGVALDRADAAADAAGEAAVAAQTAQDAADGAAVAAQAVAEDLNSVADDVQQVEDTVDLVVYDLEQLQGDVAAVRNSVGRVASDLAALRERVAENELRDDGQDQRLDANELDIDNLEAFQPRLVGTYGGGACAPGAPFDQFRLNFPLSRGGVTYVAELNTDYIDTAGTVFGYLYGANGAGQVRHTGHTQDGPGSYIETWNTNSTYTMHTYRWICTEPATIGATTVKWQRAGARP